MRILLDTHLILWWLAGDPALTKRAHQLIADPANMVLISAVSLWEIWIKVSMGKLRLPPDFQSRLAAESFESLHLTAEHTRLVASLPWHHRDPFDRMLVAQAQSENLFFLTADDVIARYGEFVLLGR